MAFIEAWKYFGFITLIYLAGLAGVPADLKQAALIDGANARQVFRHVKLPLLLPAMTVTLVLPLVGALNAFEVILATTRGGPGTATSTLNIVMFQQFGNGLLAFSTASIFVVTMLSLCHGHSAYLVSATPTSGPVKRVFFRVEIPGRSRYNAPRVKTGRLAMYAVLSAVAVAFFIVPIWIVVAGSWKPFGEAIEFSLSLPREWSLVENYSEVLDKARYLTSFGNSLLVTSVSCRGTAADRLDGCMGFWPIAIALDGGPLLRDDHRHPAASRHRRRLPDETAPHRRNVLAVIFYKIGWSAWPWPALMTVFVRGLLADRRGCRGRRPMHVT